MPNELTLEERRAIASALEAYGTSIQIDPRGYQSDIARALGHVSPQAISNAVKCRAGYAVATLLAAHLYDKGWIQGPEISDVVKAFGESAQKRYSWEEVMALEEKLPLRKTAKLVAKKSGISPTAVARICLSPSLQSGMHVFLKPAGWIALMQAEEKSQAAVLLARHAKEKKRAAEDLEKAELESRSAQPHKRVSA